MEAVMIGKDDKSVIKLTSFYKCGEKQEQLNWAWDFCLNWDVCNQAFAEGILFYHSVDL